MVPDAVTRVFEGVLGFVPDSSGRWLLQRFLIRLKWSMRRLLRGFLRREVERIQMTF